MCVSIQITCIYSEWNTQILRKAKQHNTTEYLKQLFPKEKAALRWDSNLHPMHSRPDTPPTDPLRHLSSVCTFSSKCTIVSVLWTLHESLTSNEATYSLRSLSRTPTTSPRVMSSPPATPTGERERGRKEGKDTEKGKDRSSTDKKRESIKTYLSHIWVKCMYPF